MKVEELTENIEIPEGVSSEVAGRRVKVKGKKGEVERTFRAPKLEIISEGNTIKLLSKDATRREKTQLFTTKAHIRNLFKGVLEGHKYKLKICSGHFPMNVSVSGNTLVVKNFLGEKKPRELKIKEGATVKIDGQDITVESPDIEIAGQVAADIEQLTRITNKDIRIFQDGIYIVEKAGKAL